MSKKTEDMKIKRPEDYLKRPYARVLIPEPGGGFAAEILEFPGCYTFADTAEEALRNLEEAATNWLEAAISQGQDVPEPSDSGESSGRVALRLPRSIHRKASQMAERDRVSLNTFLVDAIAARVGAEDLYSRISQRLDQRIAMLEKRAEAVTTASLNKAFDLIWPDKSKSTLVSETGSPYLFFDHVHLQIGGNT